MDTNKSHEMYKEWLVMTRLEPSSDFAGPLNLVEEVCYLDNMDEFGKVKD